MTNPKIWMNVTTSVNWNRPAVGIVRVEQSLVADLISRAGDNFNQCVWHNGEFISLMDYHSYLSSLTVNSTSKEQKKNENISQNQNIVNNSSVIQAGNSFDVLVGLFCKTPKNVVEIESNATAPLSDNITQVPSQKVFSSCLQRGDVLISVGLDWDNSYAWKFYEYNSKWGVHVITCCYDLIPVLFPQYCVGEVALKFTEYFNRLTWGSSSVLCISKQTQKDYLALCEQSGSPERETVVIPLGDNVLGDDGLISNEIKDLTSRPYILFVSTIERRKNHEVLYRAYHILASKGYRQSLPKLVFIGMPGWGVNDLLKDIELDPLTKDLIVQLNHVTDSELNRLYKNAIFCLYPSLYEGWGLPVGEALAMGKVVIASNRGSIPEVGGDLVTYLEPWNPVAWADAILEHLQNPNLIKSKEQQVLKSYKARSWTDSGKIVHELALRLLNKDQSAWTFIPGYDLSTLVGLKIGSKIQTNSTNGVLVFGPHIPFRSGKYKAVLNVNYYPDHRGTIGVEITSNNSQEVHAKTEFSNHNSNIITINYELKNDVQKFETRIIVTEDCSFEVASLIIEKIS